MWESIKNKLIIIKNFFWHGPIVSEIKTSNEQLGDIKIKVDKLKTMMNQLAIKRSDARLNDLNIKKLINNEKRLMEENKKLKEEITRLTTEKEKIRTEYQTQIIQKDLTNTTQQRQYKETLEKEAEKQKEEINQLEGKLSELKYQNTTKENQLKLMQLEKEESIQQAREEAENQLQQLMKKNEIQKKQLEYSKRTHGKELEEITLQKFKIETEYNEMLKSINLKAENREKVETIIEKLTKKITDLEDKITLRDKKLTLNNAQIKLNNEHTTKLNTLVKELNQLTLASDEFLIKHIELFEAYALTKMEEFRYLNALEKQKEFNRLKDKLYASESNIITYQEGANEQSNKLLRIEISIKELTQEREKAIEKINQHIQEINKEHQENSKLNILKPRDMDKVNRLLLDKLNETTILRPKNLLSTKQAKEALLKESFNIGKFNQRAPIPNYQSKTDVESSRKTIPTKYHSENEIYKKLPLNNLKEQVSNMNSSNVPINNSIPKEEVD